MLIILIIIIGLTSIYARDINVPEKVAREVLGEEPNLSETNEDGEVIKFYHTTSSVSEHIMFTTCFFGWLIFALFSGIGLISTPWDLILDYMYRPKPIDEGNFEDKKQLLL